MRNRIILAFGLAISLLGRADGQETSSPPSTLSSLPSDNSSSVLMPTQAFTFAPVSDDVWTTVDFLFGWTEGAKLSPLVTTSDAGTSQANAGILGRTTTQTLLSGRVNHDALAGFRLAGGYIFDQDNGQGVEAGFAYLPGQSSSFLFDSADHNGILGRPYVNVKPAPDVNAAVLVGYPGISTGSISVDAKSGDFYGVNLDLSERVLGDRNRHIDVLFGYRFASFSDSLRISQRLVPTALPGTTIDSLDDFAARNTFHGLDLGARATFNWDRVSLSLLGKATPGKMFRTVDINGRQVTTISGTPTTVPGGVYALSTNSGEHSEGKWTVVPELAANLAWQFRSNMSLRLGYSTLWLTKVARADDQINYNINPDFFPPAVPGATPRDPLFHLQQDSMWIQTINLGLEMTF